MRAIAHRRRCLVRTGDAKWPVVSRARTHDPQHRLAAYIPQWEEHPMGSRVYCHHVCVRPDEAASYRCNGMRCLEYRQNAGFGSDVEVLEARVVCQNVGIVPNLEGSGDLMRLEIHYEEFVIVFTGNERSPLRRFDQQPVVTLRSR